MDLGDHHRVVFVVNWKTYAFLAAAAFFGLAAAWLVMGARG